MFLEVSLAILIAALSQTLWLRWKYDLHKIPSPPGLPILGHTLDFSQGLAGKQFTIWFRRIHKALGFPKAFKVNVGAQPWVFVCDIDCVRSVVNHKTNPLPRHPVTRKFFGPILSLEKDMKDSLVVSCNRAYTREIRKAYMSGTQNSQLRKFFPKIKGVVSKMIQIIEDKREHGPIEFQDLCVRLTLDTIGILAFEMNLGGLDKTRHILEGIVDTGHIGREQMTSPLLALYCELFSNSKEAKERNERRQRLNKEWIQITKEILARPDPAEGEEPIWYCLKTTIDPDTGVALSFEMLRAEIATVIVAGTDTTGYQLSWTLGMIATHPEIAKKLVSELEAYGLCGSNAKDVEFDDLAKLPYLNAVVKESFRMQHIVPVAFFRCLEKDMTVLNYRMPKGTTIAFPGNSGMNTEHVWEDPDIVRPERWMTGEDMSSKYFDTFQTGSRDCPGQKLAMLEIRLVLVILFSRYHLSSDKDFEYFLKNMRDGGVVECGVGMPFYATPRI